MDVLASVFLATVSSFIYMWTFQKDMYLFPKEQMFLTVTEALGSETAPSNSFTPAHPMRVSHLIINHLIQG